MQGLSGSELLPQIPCVHFCTLGPERNHGSRVIGVGLATRENIVAGRLYLMRQAATFLKFAQSTNDPKLAAFLVEKAADLKSQVEANGKPDTSPLAPDVEPSSDS
jgi:hypothetical protein